MAKKQAEQNVVVGVEAVGAFGIKLHLSDDKTARINATGGKNPAQNTAGRDALLLSLQRTVEAATETRMAPQAG